jgi:hypothetical protein
MIFAQTDKQEMYELSHAFKEPHKHNITFYCRLLNIANQIMIVSLMILALSILACYVYDGYLSIGTQLGGHIAMIIAITSIKLAYIARCIGRHGLGKKHL